MRLLLPLCALLICASLASAQPRGALTPEEAVKKFTLPEGFSVRCVASEPMIRQPVSMSFDSRGRLWVLQYLQYPHYAGLKPVTQDRYLRTVYDRVPEPPPHGPKGLDRITILSDPDEHGVFRKSKDFVTGLNIASGFCIGNGGVYVVQPPYLLFYPDKNEDDVPDSDPHVLLSGFGMNDTHSLANSLQWGPDGWLYGAAGSTSTCKIKNPAWRKSDAGTKDSPEVIEFQQGIWRYHPKTKRFELFSEGGGNTYGLDFDRNGQVIAGTNWGGFACLHQMQGAYYLKGFSKHGPLHNPYTYGYFDHVAYTGFKGGHVTCGGVLYDADLYPAQYRGQYIAGNLLSSAIYWHKIDAVKSSFKASHGGDLMTSADPWFRPVDLMLGPDGCIYVADWYDKRAAHLDPVDDWHKTSGRIYRIEYQGGPKYPTFDLRKKSTAQLAELLKSKNKWWRNEARRLIAERGDASIFPRLRKWLFTEKEQTALESLWALASAGGWMEGDFTVVGNHENEYVRAWMVRLVGDEQTLSESTLGELQRMGVSEKSPVVAAQLACTARRFPPRQELAIADALLTNPLIGEDPLLPMLVWWAQEDANRRDTTGFIRFAYPRVGGPRVVDFFNERAARRLMSGNITRGPERAGSLLLQTRGFKGNVNAVLRGIATALQSNPQNGVPPALREPLARLRKERPKDLLVLEVLARMKDPPARAELRALVAEETFGQANRLKAVALLRDVRDPRAEELFLTQLAAARTDAMRMGLLGGLEAFDHDSVGEKILASYSGFTPGVKKRAISTLLTRPNWTQMLLKQWETGKLPKSDFTLDHARAAVKLDNKGVTAIIEKHFGKLAPATAGEKQARIGGLNIALQKEKGDAARGQVLFTKHCAACHTLHGEGGKVGPDLTTADRKNRVYLLTQIVDPSGYIRPEYMTYSVLTKDDRKLSGVARESGESVTLTSVVNDQVTTASVAKADIAEMTPSAVSLMPEKLLDTLTAPQVADLFAYLASDRLLPPKTSGARKLKVVMVSGSFEYKSDASLARLQKYLEANFPVQCTLVAAKSDKDAALKGIETLATADVAIFFTRRLQIDGDSLKHVKEYVKSGRPIIGIRTASHGFQKWLEMDRVVLGGDYKGHFGPGVADVKPTAKGKTSPILVGVKPFKTNGSLYKNPKVAADVNVLLQGFMGKESEPVAWTREKDGRRVFYTSLGHPDDFQDEHFIRLLTNALAWATKSEWKSK